MKIIDSVWPYSNEVNLIITVCIGVVLCQNEHGEISCRLGIGFGVDQMADAHFIVDHGGKLSMDQAITFFPDRQKLITENWKRHG